MRLAILSDIHANLEAFTEAIKVIDQVRPDRIISLGDAVGYGPDPEPVMKKIRRHKIESVLGNHEMVVKYPRFIRWFNPMARQAVNYTLAHLSNTSVESIRAQQKSMIHDNLRFVHGAPMSSPFIYLFQLSETNLIKKFNQMKERICFLGHTHDLELISFDGRKLNRTPLGQGRHLLAPDKKFMVNAGSIGQPRDGNTSSKFVIFDTQTNVLEVFFIPYNFTVTAKKIIQAGIPEQYAEKLSRTFKQ